MVLCAHGFSSYSEQSDHTVTKFQGFMVFGLYAFQKVRHKECNWHRFGLPHSGCVLSPTHVRINAGAEPASEESSQSQVNRFWRWLTWQPGTRGDSRRTSRMESGFNSVVRRPRHRDFSDLDPLTHEARNRSQKSRGNLTIQSQHLSAIRSRVRQPVCYS